MVSLYRWSIVCFKVVFSIHQCVSMRSYYCHRDTNLMQTFTKLWTNFFLNYPSRAGCLTLCVEDEDCGGFLYDSAHCQCTAVEVNKKIQNLRDKRYGWRTSDSAVIATAELFWVMRNNSRTANSLQRNTGRTSDSSPSVSIIRKKTPRIRKTGAPVVRSTKLTQSRKPALQTALIKVYVKTGDQLEAGSERIIVSIVLIGKIGTIERELRNSANSRKPFLRDTNDTFLINSTDIGDITMVKVKAEGKGIGDSWFLDKILIEKKTKAGDKGFLVQVYLAEMGQWITKGTHIMNIFKPKINIRTLRLRKLREYIEQN